MRTQPRCLQGTIPRLVHSARFVEYHGEHVPCVWCAGVNGQNIAENGFGQIQAAALAKAQPFIEHAADIAICHHVTAAQLR